MDVQKLAWKKQKPVDIMLDELAKKLRVYRKESNLTLKQMGDMAGVSYPMISEIENGKIGNIGLQKLLLIANALGYTFELELKPVK